MWREVGEMRFDVMRNAGPEFASIASPNEDTRA
jgi:hypothetical protein